MKDFFKNVLATIVGIVLTSLLLFFIFFGIISLILSAQDKTVSIKQNTILTLKLNQQIIDREPSFPFDLGTFSRNQKIGLNTILANISKAKKDNNISGIHMNISFVPAGIGTIEEIRSALLDFRESGKFVTVYSDIFTQGAYYLASVADDIYFSPIGVIELVGLRAQSPFFKNTLEKLDVESITIRHGKYKSAVEPFTQEGYSPENREQLRKMIDSFWDQICADIESERNISSKKLNEIADNLLVTSPHAALELGLVDSLIYEDEVHSILKSKTNIESSKDLRSVSMGDYKNVPQERSYKGLAKNKIAVIYASGEIIGGEGDEQKIGSAKFAKTIRKARKDSAVKAIVLRVNSPGGSAIASEAIWRELVLARNTKPLVVSMGDLAASGGYYISCPADTIVAQPNTITGSIGVYGMYMNTKGLFNKLGVTFDTEKTNDYSDFLSGFRSASTIEINYLQNMVDTLYETFVHRVDEGRDLSFSEIDELAQGRIWSGKDAYDLGLVDKLGGLNDAINIAKNMADLDEKYRIIELPVQEDPIEKIVRDLTQGSKIRSLEKELGIHHSYLNSIITMLENQGMMARIPFDIQVY